MLFEHGFARYIANSGHLSATTVILYLVLATVGAYAVTRLRFRGRRLMSYSVLVNPLYVIFSKMGLRDSLHVLLLVYLAQTLPVAL